MFSGGQWLSSSRWRGNLYRTHYSGAHALSQGVDPSQIQAEAFGHIQFDFQDASHAQLELTYPDYTRRLPIERFPF